MPLYSPTQPSALATVPPHFSGIFSSETIEIVVEYGRRSFFVHSDILAAQSEILRAATNASREKGEKINWPKWDGNTVERFIQFLYIGNYKSPEPVSEDEDVEEEEGEDLSDTETETGAGKQDGIHTPDTTQSQADQEELIPRDTNLLLVHAKVHLLAQYRGVEALQVMALGRLKTALQAMGGEMTPRAKSNVTELLDFAYPELSPHMESQSLWVPMQDLVSSFAAGALEMFVDRKEMELMLSNRGYFALELMKKVASRLRDSRSLSDMEKEVQGWKDQVRELSEKLEARIKENTLEPKAVQKVTKYPKKKVVGLYYDDYC